MTQPLLKVENLSKLFPVSKGYLRTPTDFIHAVDGINFEIQPGVSLGLVGESGCGKSTTGRMLVKLMDASSGQVLMADKTHTEDLIDIANIPREDMKRFRRRVQMIFQDPYESMNPRRTVFETVSEPLTVQNIGSLKEREERVSEMLRLVGLSPPDAFLFRYPHELSGGQRQRVAIARALVLDPSFVVADEPTSMLDVSIRISIMDLMLKLADEFDVSYLYITHDLAVARYMCDRIAVMYLGKIVEIGDTEEILGNPQHPYTKALMRSIPRLDERVSRLETVPGNVPPATSWPQGCRFHPRCDLAFARCEVERPSLINCGPDHSTRCFLAERKDGVEND